MSSAVFMPEGWEESHKPGRFLAAARHELGSFLRQYPAIYMPLAQRTRPWKTMSAKTDVVIEGFQRSANTFAVRAFLYAQANQANVAHHTHSAAQVMMAIRTGIPTLVLIRDPDDAVLEHWLRLRRRASVALPRVFLFYARFYEPLVPYRSEYVLGAFEEVTSDFGQVISRLNARFGTRFGLFDHTPDNAGRIFHAIEENNRRNNSGRLRELTVGRPSEERRGTVEHLRSLLDDKGVQKHRGRARRAYESLMATDSG